MGNLPQTSYIDARYQRNVADLLSAFEQQKAQTNRDLALSRQRYSSGQQELGDTRGQSYDQLYQALGGSGFGRSGAVSQGGGQIQTEYQRNMDELSRQFGPKNQKLLRDLLAISSKQLQNQLAAESGLALERKAQYEAAGQALPSFTPSEGIGKLLEDK
jgi:ribosomal protein S17E